MNNRRHTGFVVGSDASTERREVWKVRVKDPASQYDGQKFVAASVRGGLELARGLNVHFVIGTMDDPSGSKVLRAVDVCLEAPDKDQTANIKRSGGQS